MPDELTRRLVQSRRYCNARLVEVKEDIARLHSEGLGLKERLETADEAAAGEIRARRRFLSRRIEELKAERTALRTELQTATVQLSAIAGAQGE